jgi:hypothetical protein
MKGDKMQQARTVKTVSALQEKRKSGKEERKYVLRKCVHIHVERFFV